MGNRNKFVSGLTGIQLALAKTVHQLVQTHSITYFEAINRLKILKNIVIGNIQTPIRTSI